MKKKILTVCIVLLLLSAFSVVSLAYGIALDQRLLEVTSPDAEEPSAPPEYTVDDLLTAIDELDSIAKGESTNLKRQEKLTLTRNIFQSLLGNLDSNSEEYKRCQSVIARVSDELAKEAVAAEFVGYVESFYTAITVEIQQSNYDSAFEVRQNLDLDYFDEGSFPAFYEAYSKSEEMIIILAEKSMVENAKKLYACVNYVIKYDTEILWNDNYDMLVPFVKIADGMITDGGYDAYYNDLDKLLLRFEPMREYFKDRILTDHINYIKSELARYDNSEAYFERYGISIKLRDYISDNIADTSLRDLPELIRINEEHIEELLANEEQYDKFLKQNTVLFIEKCEALVGSVDYKTMKEVCESAAFYFFNMDVSDASAQDALAIYDLRTKEILKFEEKARQFMDGVETLVLSAPTDDKLTLILNAYSLLDGVDMGVDGVKDAYTLLCDEMSEYDSSVASYNSELLATREAAVYMRSSKGMESFLTLILEAIR